MSATPKPEFVRAPEQPSETMIFEADGLYVKQIVVARSGTYLPQHAHELSHLTLLAAGSVDVSCDGGLPERHEAPAGIYIAAGCKHMFKTLTDGVVLYCIHALNTPQALRVLAKHEIV